MLVLPSPCNDFPPTSPLDPYTPPYFCPPLESESTHIRMNNFSRVVNEEYFLSPSFFPFAQMAFLRRPFRFGTDFVSGLLFPEISHRFSFFWFASLLGFVLWISVLVPGKINLIPLFLPFQFQFWQTFASFQMERNLIKNPRRTYTFFHGGFTVSMTTKA